MKIIDIKNKYGDILCSIQADNLGNHIFKRFNLSYANLSNMDLYNTCFLFCDLYGVNFAKSNLSNCTISYCDLSWANLTDADLSYSQIFNTSMHGAKLHGINFDYANLKYCDLSDAQLENFQCKKVKSSNYLVGWILKIAALKECIDDVDWRKLQLASFIMHNDTWNWKDWAIWVSLHCDDEIKKWAIDTLQPHFPSQIQRYFLH